MTGPNHDDPAKEIPAWSPKPIFEVLEGLRFKGPKSEAGIKGGSATPGYEFGLQLFRVKGHQGSTLEGKDDQAWAAFFLTEAKGSLLKVEGDPLGDFSVYLVDVEATMSGIYSTADILEGLGLKDPEGMFENQVFAASAPMAARAGDPTLHGDVLNATMGSPDVIVGGKQAWRALIDYHACSQTYAAAPHLGGLVLEADPTVLINGVPAVRAGDSVLEASGGPNPIVSGAPMVLIGKVAPPVEAKVPIPARPKTGIAKYLDIDLESLIGKAKVTAQAGGTKDAKGGLIGAKLGAKAAVIEEVLDGDVRIPITDDWSITLGAEGKGSLLTAGAEVGGGVRLGGKGEDGRRRWGLEKWGGSVGAGLFGGGLKISIGLENSTP